LPLTPEKKRIRELEKKRKNTEMEREILKKPWPSSAGHRNEITICQTKQLLISGGEDVPNPQYLLEQFLSLAQSTSLAKKMGRSTHQRANLNIIRRTQRDGRKSYDRRRSAL
jgi:DhnA family fructose-bisphosphate aldolase class Ia